MTKISFYHLLHQPLENALPKLLEKVYGAGLQAVIKLGNEGRMQELNQALWSYSKAGFLPHDTQAGKHGEQQPIYLTTADENPAGATILILVDSMESADLKKYDRCLEMFDGRNIDAVAAARTRWKKYTDQGHDLTYWQQTEQGGWTEKG